MTSIEFSKLLFQEYKNFKEKSFKDKFITHKDILNLIANLSNENIFVEDAGKSTEEKEIKLIKFGVGEKRIFLWSQMHGDEPTATMAIFDILNFIINNFNSNEIQNIYKSTTLYFLPMLNPDGADRFERRNIFGIDINRDAQKLESVEAKILKNLRDKLSPDFGFNLHDQDPRYTVGRNGKVATIALLAPPIDFEKSENEVFQKAKKVTAHFSSVMKNFIDGNISRYLDDFEPRAFGDNIQKSGTSTILVESGGWQNDENKFFIRKLNCVGLLSTILAIANDEYLQADLKNYEELPLNEKFLYDYIFRNTELSHNGKSISVDVGINFEDSKREKIRVMEIGDLKNFSAFNEINLNGKIISGDKIKWDLVLDTNEMKKIFNL